MRSAGRRRAQRSVVVIPLAHLRLRLERVRASLRHVDWSWLVPGVCLDPGDLRRPGTALGGHAPAAGKTPDLWRIFTATAIGFTAVVLFGRAGEPVRPYLIAKKEGVSFSSQIAAWIVERILDLLMVLLIFGIALTQVSAQRRSSPVPEFALSCKWAATSQD